jgi:hypothetical protein
MKSSLRTSGKHGYPWATVPKLGRRAIRLLGVALLLGLSQCSTAPRRQIPITRLSGDFQLLRTQFNQDAGKVRLLLLLDPT